MLHPTQVARRGDLVQPSHVLPRVGRPVDSSDQLAAGGNDHFAGQDRNPVLLAGVREVGDVDPHGDEGGLDRRRNFLLSKDLLLHLSARLAPVGPEVDQHQPIRLRSQSFGRLQAHLPTYRLLS
jgi:hypothetical protein